MFRVFKPQIAMVELIASWIQADEGLRSSIQLAMLDLEQQLRENPYDQGESRGNGTRVLFHPPLAVTFEIDDDRRLVRILRAWTFRRVAA